MFLKASSLLFKVLSSIKREIVLVFLVFVLVLASSFFNNQIARSDQAWQVKKSVKGERTYRKGIDHLREIEVTHKTAPKIITPKEHEVEDKVLINDQVGTEGLSPKDVVAALNAYRVKKGLGPLVADASLSGFAQNRASFFSSQGGMDSHAGFESFVNSQDGFKRLGFMALGENSSFGYSLSSVDLVEKAFASHGPHDANQLNPSWTHVGVGVSGLAVDIVFGGKKL